MASSLSHLNERLGSGTLDERHRYPEERVGCGEAARSEGIADFVNEVA
jgi:hypothetical protein